MMVLATSLSLAFTLLLGQVPSSDSLLESHTVTHERIEGSATWYCQEYKSVCHHAHSSGMYAAAGSELRKGNWRGSKVRVCTEGRCVTVTLIDTCACKGKRVIDLYGDAFRRLAPLGRGVLRVTVKPVTHTEKPRPSRSPIVAWRPWLVPL